MRKALLFCALAFFAWNLQAQTRVVKGKVTAFNQYPVQNVQVSSKKAKSSVMTDEEGRFEIVCKEKDVIEISGKVFENVTKRMGKKEESFEVNLVFKDTPQNREIATGLGYFSERNLAYALAHLEDENNDFCNYSDIFSLIRGKFPGVQILDGNQVFIRGTNSIEGPQPALYVVDGMVINDISFVNPCNVRSIDVLKGAAATLYGSNAAYGVVVVETKAVIKE
ncbi:MAG: TonB-dependent receptor plug domain-containing protein [Bacteroidales bacterium]